MSDTTFLFHTMLAETGKTMTAKMRPDAAHTDVRLTEGEAAGVLLRFRWPAAGLDVLAEDCKPMVDAVLATLERNSHAESVTCFMAQRIPTTASHNAGWLEWGVLLTYASGATMYISHIQRTIGADVERHT